MNELAGRRPQLVLRRRLRDGALQDAGDGRAAEQWLAATEGHELKLFHGTSWDLAQKIQAEGSSRPRKAASAGVCMWLAATRR